MKYVKKMKIVLAAVIFAFAFNGCYTKLAYHQNETAPFAERCEDCVEERFAPRAAREVCVWERDMFGFAQLRCYNSNYSSSWFYFHNTPWWYRGQYRWYESRGCPPYYYYDRVSRRCRYFDSSHHHHGSSRPGGGGGGGKDSSWVGGSRRTQDRIVPGGSQPTQRSYESSAPMFPASSTRQLSPAGSPTTSSSSNDALSKESTPAPSQPEQRPRESTPSRRTTESRSETSAPSKSEQRPQVQEENNENTPSRRNSRGR